MEREACVCDHGFERSDLCAEIIIIIILYGEHDIHKQLVTQQPSVFSFFFSSLEMSLFPSISCTVYRCHFLFVWR